MNDLDREIVNRLQDGIPVCERPFARLAGQLGVSEEDVVACVARLLERGVLSRFGPLYNADRLGGAATLCAMEVPGAEFDAVAATVNAFPEVAHNYQREHDFNMWFVLACDAPDGIAEVAGNIERCTGYRVYRFPKLAEYYVGLRFQA